MDPSYPGTLVNRESNYYFVGVSQREILFTVEAQDFEDALSKFKASQQFTTEVLFVIKIQADIYLVCR